MYQQVIDIGASKLLEPAVLTPQMLSNLTANAASGEPNLQIQTFASTSQSDWDVCQSPVFYQVNKTSDYSLVPRMQW